MKNSLIVALLLLLNICFSLISNEKTSIIPKFEVGQSFNYEIIHTSSNKGQLNFKQITKITITVEKVLDTIAILNWTINKVDVIDSLDIPEHTDPQIQG